MGPNGSGKSTLAYSIAGHPKYHVTHGSVTLDGEDVLAMTVDERARAGPVPRHAVPGRGARRVGVELPAHRGDRDPRRGPEAAQLGKEMRAAMGALAIDPAFAERNVNEGFSGGEKKRHEILQLELLKPKIAILDETDSGLDVDALRVVPRASTGSAPTPAHGVLLITHYTRILRYIQPDFVHVFVAGRIVDAGRPRAGRGARATTVTRSSSRRREAGPRR